MAFVYPEGVKGKKRSSETEHFSKARLSQARTVLKDNAELARAVLAGVEPTFEELAGRDPLALIASANLRRRNLTKGQQAMALAFIYPEPERGRGKKDKATKDREARSFSQDRLLAARTVLAFSRPMADSVDTHHLPARPRTTLAAVGQPGPVANVRSQ